ncbi:MAG: hypothetical protein AAGF12_12790 [Myxococcota bacterium]
MAIGLVLCVFGLGCDEWVPEPTAPPPASEPEFSHLRNETAAGRETMPVITMRAPSSGSSSRMSGGGGGGSGRHVDRRRAKGLPRSGLPYTAAEAAEVSTEVVAQEPQGNSPCAQAWVAFRAVTEGYRERSPQADHTAPNRGRFMEGCLAKPRAMQECMVPTHYVANQEDCDRIARNYGQQIRNPFASGDDEPSGPTEEPTGFDPESLDPLGVGATTDPTQGG